MYETWGGGLSFELTEDGAASVLHAGLLGEHVPPPGVEGSSTRLHSVRQQNDSTSPGRRELGANLDSGHVLSQREASGVPRGDREEPASAPERHWSLVVRRQVSVIADCDLPPRHLTPVAFIPNTLFIR